jgi:hypothetical protein
LTFPTIDIQQPGNYIAKFYTLFYCNTTGCENAGDYLSFKINDGQNVNEKNLIYKEISINGLDKERVWIKREFNFSAPSNKLNVNNINFNLKYDIE